MKGRAVEAISWVVKEILLGKQEQKGRKGSLLGAGWRFHFEGFWR